MNTLVVLAAGQGSRLRPLTNALPKCLLEVAGRSILDRLLEHFSGWSERTVVVSGFESEQVERRLSELAVPGELRLCRNPDYAESNSLYSAWFARDHWRHADAVVLTNADVLFRPHALDDLLASPGELLLSVRGGPCDAEDMKVALDAAGGVKRVSKQIPPAESAGEFSGVSLARGNGIGLLLAAMETLLEEPGMRAHAWYDQALDAIASRRVAGQPELGWVTLPDDSYWEIDTLEDLCEVRSAQALGGEP